MNSIIQTVRQTFFKVSEYYKYSSSEVRLLKFIGHFDCKEKSGVT